MHVMTLKCVQYISGITAVLNVATFKEFLHEFGRPLRGVQRFLPPPDIFPLSLFHPLPYIIELLTICTDGNFLTAVALIYLRAFLHTIHVRDTEDYWFSFRCRLSLRHSVE